VIDKTVRLPALPDPANRVERFWRGPVPDHALGPSHNRKVNKKNTTGLPRRALTRNRVSSTDSTGTGRSSFPYSSRRNRVKGFRTTASMARPPTSPQRNAPGRSQRRGALTLLLPDRETSVFFRSHRRTRSAFLPQSTLAGPETAEPYGVPPNDTFSVPAKPMISTPSCPVVNHLLSHWPLFPEPSFASLPHPLGTVPLTLLPTSPAPAPSRPLRSNVERACPRCPCSTRPETLRGSQNLHVQPC